MSFVYASSGPWIPELKWWGCLSEPPGLQGRQFLQGDLYLALQETKEGQHALPVLTTCEVTLIQTNQYGIVEYLGELPCPSIWVLIN